ncbi:MAG: RNA polymerase sigma factor [Gemmatimonadota bacterium]
MSDGDLIAQYLAGDEQAATELVRRHTAALARFLAVQGAPDDELEDVVQDSFVKAFRGLRSFRGGARFRTWLLAIGANVLKDRRRLWRKRVVVELSPDLPDRSADPAGEAEAGWTAARLAEEIGKLPRLQRGVFVLRAQQGVEYGEIAKGLGISEGSARVHFHHAVKRLKERVQ